MLDLTQVKTFLTVVEQGGFARAAQVLGTTQPVVSQQVKRLETELATRLVVRSKARSVPTQEGQKFLPHARALLRAEAKAREAFGPPALTIAASSNIGTYLLPGILADRSRTSDLAIDVLVGTNHDVADHVESGTADLALMEWWDDRPGFEAQHWHSDPLLVIVAPDHKWAKRRSIRKEMLLGERMVGGEKGTGTGRILNDLFGRTAGDLKIGLTVGSTAAVKEVVKAGLGVSLVMESAVREELEHGSLAALRLSGPALTKQLYAIHPSDLPPTSPAIVFANKLARTGLR